MLKIRQSQLNLASLTYVLVKAFRVAVVVMVGGGGEGGGCLVPIWNLHLPLYIREVVSQVLRCSSSRQRHTYVLNPRL